jgi:mannosidase alpha-like ER degradation enhancer 1
MLIAQYLYLLFDEAAASSPGTNSVFTTEGHVLSLPHSLQTHPSPIRRALHRSEQQYCPAYRPPSLGGLRVGIEQRDDYEYARTLIYGEELNDDTVHQERRFWSEHGRCAVPQVPKHVRYDPSCRYTKLTYPVI